MTKRTYGTLTLACAFAVLTAVSTHETRADEALPACAVSGDKDADGVSDGDDSAETDSCVATSSGFEDCSTGAGDGIPDCAESSN